MLSRRPPLWVPLVSGWYHFHCRVWACEGGRGGGRGEGRKEGELRKGRGGKKGCITRSIHEYFLSFGRGGKKGN